MALFARFKLSRRIVSSMVGSVFAGMSGFLFTSTALAGPFGFNLKDSRKPAEAYRSCEKVDGTIFNFACTTAPKPHPAMEVYLIRFIEDVGICRVRGATSDILDDGSGRSLRLLTDRIADQIKRKYGEWGYQFDEIDDSSIFSGLTYWMYSLERGERSYGYAWFSRDLSTEHRNSIDHISLEARALNSNTGFIMVNFTTPLENACEKSLSDVF